MIRRRRYRQLKDDILHYLYELEFATVNNLYSRTGRTEKGSLLATGEAMNQLVNEGAVKAIPMNDTPRWKKIETFYYLTKKGAKRVNADTKVKSSWESKSIENVYHESIVRDVARAFLDSYDDVYLNFHSIIGNNELFPDIYIEADGYVFLVEVERKSEPNRTIREKILNKYEKAELNGVNPKAKVLFVWCTRSLELAGSRPQGFDRIPGHIDELERKYQILLKNAKGYSPHRYRFLPFHKFHQLNQKVWDCPDGSKTKLINK